MLCAIVLTASNVNKMSIYAFVIVWKMLLQAGSAAVSSAGIVFTHEPIFWVFGPQGRHVAPIKVKFGKEDWTVGPLSALPCLDRFRVGGLRPQKLKKWMKCDVFHFFYYFYFFENNIASAFVGRFRCGLQHFFAEEKPFQTMEQFSKLSLGGTTICARIAEKNWKSEKVAKFVRTMHFDHL